MNRYDHIEEVEKNIDVIEEVKVEKFNPFHDSRGRFSNKNGFASYSANPNTKAGAMAIARSAAAGHGSTMNVHRDAKSTGPTIRHNANWMGSGNQGNPRWQGSGTLRNRVEPGYGLRGASVVGSQWQQSNQKRGRTTQPGKQPANQPQQKPATPKQTQPQQQQPAQQKPTPQKQPQKPAQQKPDRQPVDGKDISKTFKYDPNGKGEPLDQVADQQGYKGKPTLVKDRAEFSAAVTASGIMAYRTLGNGTDVVTGKRKTGDEFADDLKNADVFSHNGTGGKVYSGGIYIAAASNAKKGVAPSRSDTNAAKKDSQGYGAGSIKTVAVTLAANAKIGDFNAVESEFYNLPRSSRQKYGNDISAYAASKGYDALKAVGAGWGCDYVMVYNRTKLVIFDG